MAQRRVPASTSQLEGDVVMRPDQSIEGNFRANTLAWFDYGPYGGDFGRAEINSFSTDRMSISVSAGGGSSLPTVSGSLTRSQSGSMIRRVGALADLYQPTTTTNLRFVYSLSFSGGSGAVHTPASGSITAEITTNETYNFDIFPDPGSKLFAVYGTQLTGSYLVSPIWAGAGDVSVSARLETLGGGAPTVGFSFGLFYLLNDAVSADMSVEFTQ